MIVLADVDRMSRNILKEDLLHENLETDNPELNLQGKERFRESHTSSPFSDTATILQSNLETGSSTESHKTTIGSKEDDGIIYTCQICSASYKYKKTLNKHLKEKHFPMLPICGQLDEDDNERYGDSEESNFQESEKESKLTSRNQQEEGLQQFTRWCADQNSNRTFPDRKSRLSLSTNVEFRHHKPLKRNWEDSEDKENQPPNAPHIKQRYSLTPMSFTSELMYKDPNITNRTMNLSSTLKSIDASPISIRQEHTQNQPTFTSDSFLDKNIIAKCSNKVDSFMTSGSHQPLDLSTSQDGSKTPDVITRKEPPLLPKLNSNDSSALDVKMLIVLLKTLVGALENENQNNLSKISETTTNLIHTFGSLLTTIGKQKQSPVDTAPNLCEPSGLLLQNNQIKTTCIPSSLPNTNFPVINPNMRFNIPIRPLGIDQNFPLADVRFNASLQSNFPMPGSDIPMYPMKNKCEQVGKKRYSLKPNFSFARKNVLNEPKKFSASPSQSSRKSLSALDNLMFANTKMALNCGNEVMGPITCNLCPFEARWFSELRAHMVNHSEHRMFGCCYCNYRAKWKWDVAKHMRRCALSRHVAHLPNEGLLRMVNYHPPPEGDVLFNFFPKSDYPGVGIDKPIDPPNYKPENPSTSFTPSTSKSLPLLKPKPHTVSTDELEQMQTTYEENDEIDENQPLKIEEDFASTQND